MEEINKNRSGMMSSNLVHSPKLSADRKSYVTPQLVGYGSVAVLTKASVSGTNELGPTSTSPACANGPGFTTPCIPSDVRCKVNVVRMGAHSSGIGLYLYNYSPEFAARMGCGKFLGVMAQEVLEVNPSAVVLDESGYYAVDYRALGPATLQ